MGKYSLVERRMVIPYDAIEVQYLVTGNLSCLSQLFYCLYTRLLRRELIHISVFTSPYELRQTQNVNSTVFHKLQPTINTKPKTPHYIIFFLSFFNNGSQNKTPYRTHQSTLPIIRNKYILMLYLGPWYQALLHSFNIKSPISCLFALLS